MAMTFLHPGYPIMLVDSWYISSQTSLIFANPEDGRSKTEKNSLEISSPRVREGFPNNLSEERIFFVSVIKLM